MELLLPLSTAFLLGTLHAFEADHMAAVSAFAVRRPRAFEAMRFGVRWAAGHGAVLIVIGTLIAAAGVRIPEASGHWLERVVGASLVLLGAWTVLGARTLHAHAHTHEDGTTHVHLHSHLMRSDHRHGHAATAIGALHGLAGTAPALALVPVVSFDSPLFAAGYLVLFAVGTALGMALYALIAGWIAGRAALRSQAIGRVLAVLTGLATSGIGVFWMVR
ncbi:MAG TPA: sulfite exporter TauE/SafE family protein [Longimicrobiales bacterium]